MPTETRGFGSPGSGVMGSVSQYYCWEPNTGRAAQAFRGCASTLALSALPWHQFCETQTVASSCDRAD